MELEMKKNTTPKATKAPVAKAANTQDAGEPADNVSRPEFKKPMKISFESAMALEEAVAYFEAIVTGLKKGSIEFRRGADSLSLRPGSQVNVEVKASGKGHKEKVTFELSWVIEPQRDFEIA
jgi:amphi-Trp domain-containing protein